MFTTWFKEGEVGLVTFSVFTIQLGEVEVGQMIAWSVSELWFDDVKVARH